jgi:hypothetical protein
VAKKDFNLPKHGDIDTKNLYVIKACQSLTSRGFLKTQFSWQVSLLLYSHRDNCMSRLLIEIVLLLHPHPRGS